MRCFPTITMDMQLAAPTAKSRLSDGNSAFTYLSIAINDDNVVSAHLNRGSIQNDSEVSPSPAVLSHLRGGHNGIEMVAWPHLYRVAVERRSLQPPTSL